VLYAGKSTIVPLWMVTTVRVDLNQGWCWLADELGELNIMIRGLLAGEQESSRRFSMQARFCYSLLDTCMHVKDTFSFRLPHSLASHHQRAVLRDYMAALCKTRLKVDATILEFGSFSGEVAQLGVKILEKVLILLTILDPSDCIVGIDGTGVGAFLRVYGK
jgi:hypothetical protein